MSISILGSLLESTAQFQQLRNSLGRSRAKANVQVLADAAPYLLATLRQRLETPVLLITPRPDDARRLYDQLTFWSDGKSPILHFPETESLPFERLVADVDTTHQRLRVLGVLAEVSVPAPVVVASTVAVTQRTIDRKLFSSSSHVLRRGQTVELDDLLKQWQQMSYQMEPAAYTPGSASRRGGILDIFPISLPMPVRIELWGNQIDSIRRFDPATQRSLEEIDEARIIPARETLPALVDRDLLRGIIGSFDPSNCNHVAHQRLSEELEQLLDGMEVEELDFYAGLFNRGSLLEYFPSESLLVISRPSEVDEAAREAESRSAQLRSVKEQRGELPLHFPSSHVPWNEVEQKAANFSRRLDILPWGAQELTHQDLHALPFTSTPSFLGKLENFVQEADALAREGDQVIVVTSHARRLGEIFADYGAAASQPSTLVEVPAPGTITILQSEGPGLSDGFILSLDGRRLLVFSDTEIFGVAKQRRAARRTGARREAFLTQLSPGDFVVHVEHGIGKFLGTGQMPGDKGSTEYLILQYAHGDKLYVPMEHLDRVTPYIAPMDHPPNLTRLGTQEWKHAKERVARSTREMAAELLHLYAARELVKGHSFPPDMPWLEKLEESFPYEETPDQLATLADVKADMESNKPMDRLVCGDVGYGKTEIAVRAAFKAVMGGHQVAVLVPTTVLAQQHYVTFSQRLSPYPTTVDVLSRFRTDAEQRAIVDGLASGRIDICIGTHRLIQKDVRFKDLGLVIIDEEQRFGVAHKEQLKKMRREVDVLTLTATPIPRTLHMSLAGVRDMSTIETPPEQRLPIKTYVSEFSDELIREVILRELDRQGQVYFLHNRVHNIDYMAKYVQSLVQQARIGVAHGQMPEAQLEQTMLEFAEGKMDVLVCTTIIESGLDIPNVNTLIINRADTFGLAQLYQLRGRVGRSARRAYAYLLIPKARSLTEPAEKRLKTMLAATELGAGFQIAMKDLEIRGAGNILGGEQSGHIQAVGFDLYTRLLATAVEQLRAHQAAGNSLEQGKLDLLGEALGTEMPLPSANGDGKSEAHAAIQAPAILATRPAVDLGIPASIPPEYISDLPTRLGIYQRLVTLADLQGVADMEEELHDRFGPLPWQVQNLLYVVRLKLQAQRAGIESVSREDHKIILRLKDDVGGAKGALLKLLGPGVDVGSTQVRLELGQLADGWQGPLVDTVEKLAGFRERVSTQLAPAPAG